MTLGMWRRADSVGATTPTCLWQANQDAGGVARLFYSDINVRKLFLKFLEIRSVLHNTQV